MTWTTRKRAGFWLAATLSDDTALARCKSGLTSALAQQLSGPGSCAESCTPAERDARLKAWLHVLRPTLDECALGLPRAVARHLVPFAEANVAARLRRDAPAIDPDFQPDADLSALMLRLARRLTADGGQT